MDRKLAGLVFGFVFIVIALALLTALADQTTSVTQTYTVVNESAVLVNGTPVALQYGIIQSISGVINASNATVAAANYTLQQPKSITLLNGINGTYRVTYTYVPVGSGSTNTLVGLVVLLFALALFTTALYYLNPTFRDTIDGLIK